jgi:hypothetical protein
MPLCPDFPHGSFQPKTGIIWVILTHARPFCHFLYVYGSLPLSGLSSSDCFAADGGAKNPIPLTMSFRMIMIL